ncbi:MAG TPA: hypothetical protein VF177_01875, partial [Anaerolineae bacterium]
MSSAPTDTEKVTAVEEVEIAVKASWRRYLRWAAVLSGIVLLFLLWQPLINWITSQSWNVWLGALAQGLGFGAVAIGVYLTFRV